MTGDRIGPIAVCQERVVTVLCEFKNISGSAPILMLTNGWAMALLRYPSATASK